MTRVSLGWLAESIRATQRDDYDLSTMITGAKRKGKSTLAWQLARKVQPDFDPERQLVYTFRQFANTVRGGRRYDVIWCDEAIGFLYAKNWNTPETRAASRLIAQYGYRNYCYLYCLPRVADLLTSLRDDEVRLWLHVADRGSAVLLRKLDNPLSSDPWHIESYRRIAERIIARASASGDSGGVLAAIAHHPMARGVVDFGRMEEEESYLRWKERGLQAQEEEGGERRWEVAFAQLAVALKQQKLMSLRQMAEVVEMTHPTISAVIRRNGLSVEEEEVVNGNV